MTLPAGTRLGPYEILAPLGAGGMEEVYRARDKRLKRGVAIKVLPISLSTDPDRLRRFEHEAHGGKPQSPQHHCGPRHRVAGGSTVHRYELPEMSRLNRARPIDSSFD